MKTKRPRILVLVFSLIIIMMITASCSGSTADNDAGDETSGSARYTHLSMEDARVLIEESGEDFILVDTRTKAIYKHDHIPGAICIPDTDITDLSNDDTVPGLPDKDQMIIVYCQFGGVSKIAAEKLCDMGYTNVVEFDGMDYWEGEVTSGEEP